MLRISDVIMILVVLICFCLGILDILKGSNKVKNFIILVFIMFLLGGVFGMGMANEYLKIENEELREELENNESNEEVELRVDF